MNLHHWGRKDEMNFDWAIKFWASKSSKSERIRNIGSMTCCQWSSTEAGALKTPACEILQDTSCSDSFWIATCRIKQIKFRIFQNFFFTTRWIISYNISVKKQIRLTSLYYSENISKLFELIVTWMYVVLSSTDGTVTRIVDFLSVLLVSSDPRED